jgi:hypothetical protein
VSSRRPPFRPSASHPPLKIDCVANRRDGFVRLSIGEMQALQEKLKQEQTSNKKGREAS